MMDHPRNVCGFGLDLDFVPDGTSRV